jgi:Uma2 family endonuclease
MIARHAFTTDEWHRMGELGLFDDNARVELLDGDIIDMTPIGSRHAGTVNRLTRLLVNAVDDRGVVAPQNPVLLDEHSEPRPDLAVLAPRADDYTLAHAEPEEILLLIEVSDSSLTYDRDRKAPYYARAGVLDRGSQLERGAGAWVTVTDGLPGH